MEKGATFTAGHVGAGMAIAQPTACTNLQLYGGPASWEVKTMMVDEIISEGAENQRREMRTELRVEEAHLVGE